jgi:hypothetical protein
MPLEKCPIKIAERNYCRLQGRSPQQLSRQILPFGIICLIAELTAASFVTWRGRWREGPIRRFTSAMTSA